jgi:lipoate-protein ligase A
VIANGLSGFWIDRVPRPGFENMAIDHAMFEFGEDAGAHLWRLYRWEPARRRYHLDMISAEHLACVRRPTGGRAVWHARELTYAVAAPLSQYGSLKLAYRAIHEILAQAVASLGLAPALAAERTTPGLGSGPCFAAAAGGEVLVGGKKVIGSAQRRGERSLLQHGSMLLEDDQAVVRRLHVAESQGEPPEAPLSRLLGRPVDFETAATAVAEALVTAGVPALPQGAPNEVLRRAERHYDTYQSDSWTWDR